MGQVLSPAAFVQRRCLDGMRQWLHPSEEGVRREVRTRCTLDRDRIDDANVKRRCESRVVLDNHSAHISKETVAYLSERPGRFEYVHTPKHGRSMVARAATRSGSARGYTTWRAWCVTPSSLRRWRLHADARRVPQDAPPRPVSGRTDPTSLRPRRRRRGSDRADRMRPRSSSAARNGCSSCC